MSYRAQKVFRYLEPVMRYWQVWHTGPDYPMCTVCTCTWAQPRWRSHHQANVKL